MAIVPLISLTPLVVTMSAEATAVAASSLREQLRAWLRERGARPELVNDIVIGVNEALANCVDHAYTGHQSPGVMTLKAAIDESVGTVNVWVIDEGRWRQPPRRRERDTRGRGIILMHALADDCTINGRSDGTTVRLRYRIR